MHLFANGQPAGDAVLSAENGWSYVWKDLAKLDASGAEIVYSVTEDAVENYMSEGGGSGTVISFTNSYMREEHEFDENGDEWIVTYGPGGQVLGRRRVLGAGRARTGDESNLPLWGGMAAASLLGIGAVAMATKRRKKEDEEE